MNDKADLRAAEVLVQYAKHLLGDAVNALPNNSGDKTVEDIKTAIVTLASGKVSDVLGKIKAQTGDAK